MKSILIVFAGIIIIAGTYFLLESSNLPKLTNFKIIPTNETIPSESKSNTPPNQNTEKVPQAWSLEKNNTTNLSTENKNLKTYQADGFSFQYDSKAQVRIDNITSSYFVREVGNNNEYSKKTEMIFINHAKIDPKDYCINGARPETTILDGKTFVYCDYPKKDYSPYKKRVYFYDTPKGLLTISTTFNGSTPYTYIIPTSVIID